MLTTQQKASNGTITWQHFIYEKLTDDAFKMTFEVSRDGNTWHMVDYLVFNRMSAG
ncbi:hypothetical protein [Pontibacter pamirensis]|uniref:hypothetical protein n=1 Tax=Pontibacter pamirensis TaxID=2562824 RepID=UPI00138A1053|nr:hypothetical protein [Pontibacter pamirensis]